jgi:Skp family chaperone for outer membrane proteins
MRAAVVAAWLLGAGAAFAQAQPTPQVELPPPVLTIDADRLLAESTVGRALLEDVEAAARRLSDEVEQMAQRLAEENRSIEADLLAEERALTERRSMMSPDEFRPLAEAFDEKVQRLRSEQDEKEQLYLAEREATERALADLREEGRQRFFREAVPVLSEIVREQGALVLLDRRDVFLSADAIDITNVAIARIDAAVAPPEDATPGGEAPTETAPAQPAP